MSLYDVFCGGECIGAGTSFGRNDLGKVLWALDIPVLDIGFGEDVAG